MRVYHLLILLLNLLLIGCDLNPGIPSDDQVFNDFSPSGYAEPLTQAEFDNLSSVQKYQVANKIANTFFKGISVEDFFDITNTNGMTNLAVKQTSFIDQTREALRTDLNVDDRKVIDDLISGVDANGNPDPDNAKYNFDGDKARQLPLARVSEYPISRDGFVEWMAYFLMNTIMFSPALEMESTDIGDVQNISRTLVSQLSEGLSARLIIRSHLPTQARWRVSRSPENHALEAYELYLGLFETEEDSRKGGIACQEWRLTDEDEGYQLQRTDEINTEPQVILDGFFITRCSDLYDVVAGHSLLMPRLVEVISNYMLAERSAEDRLSLVESIVNSQPETFEDIFKGIIFSREYLLNSDRPKSFEENMLPLLGKFKWDAAHNNVSGDINENVFRNMASRQRTFSQIHMGEMGWNTMSYKIGRVPNVSMDALSFANYHKAIRERVLMYTGAYRYTLLYDPVNTSTPRDYFDQMTPAEYLDYLFLTAVHRKATVDEQADLSALFGPGSFNWFRNENNVLVVANFAYDDVARVTFDYITRLPEFYYFKTVN